MSSLSNKIGDGIHSTPEYDENGTYFFINGNNFQEGKIVFSSNTKRVSEEEAYKNNANVLTKDSILLSINGTIGSLALYNEEQIMLGKSACFINPSEECNRSFLFHCLQSKRIQNYFVSELTGTTIKNLSLQSIRNTVVFTPSTIEQRKIATLLSLIDERIATQNKIIDRLESLIEGLCVNLQLIGLKDNTWQKVYLREVLTERKENNKDNYEIHSVSVSHGIINQIEYLGRSFAAKDTSNYHVVKNGDVVYTKSPTGEFPYGIVKQSMIIENVAVSPLYGVYIPKNKYIGTILHYYFMNYNNTNNYLHPLIQKGAKNTINITNQHFLDNAVILPSNTEEIKNVASLLSSTQYKITTNNKLLNSYKKQKQYLLQQMFI